MVEAILAAGLERKPKLSVMKLLIDRPTTQLYYDANQRVVMGKMIGDIKLVDYQKMLLTGAKLAKAGKVDKIIVDRREITRQDSQCRLWVKNYYIREHVKPLVPSIKKVAIIDAKSAVGRWYGKTILSTLSLFYPNLRMKSFEELESAKEWMTQNGSDSVLIEEETIQEEKFIQYTPIRKAESETEQVTVEPTPIYTNEVNQSSKTASLLNRLFSYFFPESLA